MLQASFSMGEELMGSKSVGGMLQGIIEKIDGNVVTISQSQPPPSKEIKTIDIQANNDTQYKAVTSISQLQKGDKVKVVYKEENDKFIAEEIDKIIETAPVQAIY